MAAVGGAVLHHPAEEQRGAAGEASGPQDWTGTSTDGGGQGRAWTVDGDERGRWTSMDGGQGRTWTVDGDEHEGWTGTNMVGGWGRAWTGTSTDSGRGTIVDGGRGRARTVDGDDRGRWTGTSTDCLPTALTLISMNQLKPAVLDRLHVHVNTSTCARVHVHTHVELRYLDPAAADQLMRSCETS